MAAQKKPDINKVVDMVMDYVKNTMSFIKERIPTPKTAKEVSALENEINKKFEELPPKEQAHMLFFGIMIITKLARLAPKTGKEFSNPVLMAQTFMTVMDAAVSKLDMDIVDIAFSVISEPVYEMKDGDVERLATELQGWNLADLDPKGNA